MTEEKPDGYYQLLSIKQVAARLGVSRSFVQKITDSGELKSVPIGKRGVKVRECELRRFIDSLENGQE